MKHKHHAVFVRTKHPVHINVLIALLLSGILMIAAYEIINSKTFQLFGRVTAQVQTDEKLVALTFDDGPIPGNTERMIQILDDNDVSATFYLVGKEVADHPDQARKLIDAGHEIGNHSYSHEFMVFTSYSFARKEIERTDELFSSLGYQYKTTFRPPFGDRFVTLPLYLRSVDKDTIMWNIAPDDDPEIADSAENIVNYVNEEIEPGSIIILHTMYDYREQSLLAVEPIIESLRSKGYTFVTVSELLERKQ